MNHPHHHEHAHHSHDEHAQTHGNHDDGQNKQAAPELSKKEQAQLDRARERETKMAERQAKREAEKAAAAALRDEKRAEKAALRDAEKAEEKVAREKTRETKKEEKKKEREAQVEQNKLEREQAAIERQTLLEERKEALKARAGDNQRRPRAHKIVFHGNGLSTPQKYSTRGKVFAWLKNNCEAGKEYAVSDIAESCKPFLFGTNIRSYLTKLEEMGHLDFVLPTAEEVAADGADAE